MTCPLLLTLEVIPVMAALLMAALTVDAFAPVDTVTSVVLIVILELVVIDTLVLLPVIVGIRACHPTLPTNCHVLSYVL